MLTRINLIRQLGRFQHIVPENLPENGNLKKINLIYAPNGSGKTSLSIIFQSIATKNVDVIFKKRNRLSNLDPEFVLEFDNNKEVSFKKGILLDNHQVGNSIRIFNSYFISDNVHVFNIEKNGFYVQNMINYDEKDHVNRINERLKEDFKERNRKNHYIKNLKEQQKKIKKDSKKYRNLNERIDKTQAIKLRVQKRIDKNQSKLQQIYEPYLDKIEYTVNEILTDFNTDFYIQMSKIVYQNVGLDENSGKVILSPRLIFDIIFSNNLGSPLLVNDIGGRDSIDYVLSDGDKSALTFALYMALLKLEGVEDKVIFVDDPFSSLDSERRFMTIQYLVRISEDVEQLIITSHDENFLEELQNELINNQFDRHGDILCMNIEKSSDTYSKLIKRSNFESKDSLVVTYIEFKEFLYTKGEISDKLELRDITMKIRPFLERIFKIKYPEFYVEGQTWLKNYLDFIKNSNSDKKYQDFQKLYPYLNDLKDILAYTRPFNHDDAKDSFSKLRFKQTKQMVEKTLRLFHVI